MEAYAGRAAMEIKARRLANAGHKTALFKIMQSRGRDRLSSGVWAKALARGDKMAIMLVERAAVAVGVAVANAVNLTDVEAIVIGGGLGGRLGQPFVDAINKEMLVHIVQPTRPPAVLLAELGDLGGAIGAGLLVERLTHTSTQPIKTKPPTQTRAVAD